MFADQFSLLLQGLSFMYSNKSTWICREKCCLECNGFVRCQKENQMCPSFLQRNSQTKPSQSKENGVLSVLSCWQCCPVGLLVQAKILASRWRPKDQGTRSEGEESECRQVNVPVDTDTLAVGRPVVLFFFGRFRSSTNGSLVL